MTFSNLKLPDNLCYGSTGGIQFATEVMQTHSGAEYRVSKWDYPVNKYNISPALNSLKKVKALQAFFRVHRGRAVGFRFKDFLDYEQKEQIIACGDGKTRKYEFFKSYWHGDKFIKRRIYKPVEGTVKIYVDKNKVAAKIDYERGEFVLNKIPKPGAIIMSTFEFDVPVRFDADFLEMSANTSKVRNLEIPVIEIKDVEEVEKIEEVEDVTI